MAKYAIGINEDTLDLIRVLNGGVKPLIEEDTCFVFETNEDGTDIINHDIKLEDDLYDDKGSSLDYEICWLIG